MSHYALFYLPRYNRFHYTEEQRLRDQQEIGIDIEDVIHALLETKATNHSLEELEALRDMVDEHIDDPVGRMMDHELTKEEQQDFLNRAFKAQTRVTELMRLADIYLAAYALAMNEAGELLKLESFVNLGTDSYRVKFKVRPRDGRTAEDIHRAAHRNRRSGVAGNRGAPTTDPSPTMSLRKFQDTVGKMLDGLKIGKPPKAEDK